VTRWFERTDRSSSGTERDTAVTTHILDEPIVNAAPRGATTLSPVLPIVGGLAAGAALAVALLLGPASSGSEPLVTGSVSFAFGLGWGLMAWLSTRASAQPQSWMAVPALCLGSIGLFLIVVQPGPALMDSLACIWPPAVAILAVWMVAQVRHHLSGRSRWLVVPVIATLLLFAVGGAVTTVTAATRSSVAAAGQMVDVGGHRLYLECIGSGSPTVVLQAGLGEASASWARIAPLIAASARVCAYDRAGHGRSDEAGPQDGIALATDLHTLLEGAGEAEPYVLVGHSSGGAYVRVFAERYPDEIAGMVLLDAQPADAFDALPGYPAFYEGYRRVATLAPSLARVGLLGPMLGLPADQSTTPAARAGRDEIRSLPAALQQAQALTSLADRPLIVVTAGSGQQTGWLEAQAKLPDLSTNSAQRILDAATHTSLISGADASTSTQAILDVVASIQSGTAVR
jgi:pimeloyl-ACP methyl ester carboxylesterase